MAKTLLSAPKEFVNGAKLTDVISVSSGYRLIFDDASVIFMPLSCWQFHARKFPKGLQENMVLNAGWKDGLFSIDPA